MALMLVELTHYRTDSFVYDPAGNRVQKSRDALSDGAVDTRTTYRFDSNDHLIDELSHNAAGEVESQTTHAYHYTQNTGYTATHQPHSDSQRSLLDHTYSTNRSTAKIKPQFGGSDSVTLPPRQARW